MGLRVRLGDPGAPPPAVATRSLIVFVVLGAAAPVINAIVLYESLRSSDSIGILASSAALLAMAWWVAYVVRWRRGKGVPA